MYVIVVGFLLCNTFLSVSRTSSILSKDHPPDKKPKSDKSPLPSNEFDPTGKFSPSFSRPLPLSLLSHEWCDGGVYKA